MRLGCRTAYERRSRKSYWKLVSVGGAWRSAAHSSGIRSSNDDAELGSPLEKFENCSSVNRQISPRVEPSRTDTHHRRLHAAPRELRGGVRRVHSGRRVGYLVTVCGFECCTAGDSPREHGHPGEHQFGSSSQRDVPGSVGRCRRGHRGRRICDRGVGGSRVAGYHPRTDPLEDLRRLIDKVTVGDFCCSPKVSAILLKRFSAIASQRIPESRELILTARELEILKLLELGLSNRDIADKRFPASLRLRQHPPVDDRRRRRHRDAALPVSLHGPRHL